LFATKLEELGVEVRCYDPFLVAAVQGNRKYYSLDEVLECDVVSLHVPLTSAGVHSTLNLIGDAELTALTKNAILINACRGGVVDELALKSLLLIREDIMTVFDVWENEPAIESSLAQCVDIATPHIAGYSAEAKSNATKILALEFERYFRLGPAIEEEAGKENPGVLVVEDAPGESAQWSTLLTALPLDELSEQFKRELSDGVGTEAFDTFRQKLLTRREFISRRLRRDTYSLFQQQQLTVLGFRFE